MPNEKDEDIWQDDEGEEIPSEYEAYLKTLPPKTAETDEAEGVYLMTADEAAKAMKQQPKPALTAPSVKLPTAPVKKSAEKYMIKKSPEPVPFNANDDLHPETSEKETVLDSTTLDSLRNALDNASKLGHSAPSQSQEIQSLIVIREYVNVMINNYNRDKKDLAELRSMLILIDNKIVSMLLSDQFKEYVDFKNARAAMLKAAEVNNIKSGMKKP